MDAKKNPRAVAIVNTITKPSKKVDPIRGLRRSGAVHGLLLLIFSQTVDLPILNWIGSFAQRTCTCSWGHESLFEYNPQFLFLWQKCFKELNDVKK